jgi:hypothetical protein
VTRKKTKKKSQNERMNRSAQLHSNSSCLDQDETFAYIVGYTEGGLAYGVTWEEWEQFEQERSNYSELEIGRKPPGQRLGTLESRRIYQSFSARFTSNIISPQSRTSSRSNTPDRSPVRQIA